MKETLEQFTERMGAVEKEEEFWVNERRGHSRAVFKFEGMYCCLESTGYVTPPSGMSPGARLSLILRHEPTDYWWTDFEEFGESRSRRIARHYGGRAEETPYGEDGWYYFHFDEFENLCKLLYDRKTGVFDEMWKEAVA